MIQSARSNGSRKLGAFFIWVGAKRAKVNGSGCSQLLLKVMPDGELPKTEQQNTGRKTSFLPVLSAVYPRLLLRHQRPAQHAPSSASQSVRRLVSPVWGRLSVLTSLGRVRASSVVAFSPAASA